MRFNPFCYGLLALLAAASYFHFHSFWAWLMMVNIATLLLYGIDKFAARKSWQRIPEMTLLMFAQQVFRHKTQKQPFRSWFMLSVVVNVVALVGWGYWQA